MNKVIIFVVLGTLVFGNTLAAENNHSDHDHGKNKEEHSDHKHKGKHDNLDEKKHGEHGDHENEKRGGHAEKGHGEHEEGSKAVGKNKAITAVDQLKGFKLSTEAIKTLKLKLRTVNGDEFEILKSSLVISRDKKGVYRFRGGFFKLLNASIISETKNGYKVKVVGVEFGDQIVTDGLGLLRISDVYSTDKSNYGHSH